MKENKKINSLAILLVLTISVSLAPAFADTPTENSATVTFDSTIGQAIITWDFGTHSARDSCIVKTDTYQFPYFLDNGDEVDPADPDVLNSTRTSFIGTNTSTVYSDIIIFRDILADPAKLADATIPCVGSMTYNIPDRFLFNDIRLFMTFGEIINPGNLNESIIATARDKDTMDGYMLIKDEFDNFYWVNA